MLTETQQEDFASLKVELIDLNILACFYVRKLNRLGYLFRESTRYYILEEFTALRCMENGLILHLTKLDDDSSTFSFRKIIKEVNKTIKDQQKIKKFKNKIDSYRQNVNTLKVQHRNKRIAHLNYSQELNFDEFLNFDTYLKPLITEANEVGDFIFGKKIEYRLKLGSLEGILNFREIFETLKFDPNDQKDFS